MSNIIGEGSGRHRRSRWPGVLVVVGSLLVLLAILALILIAIAGKAAHASTGGSGGLAGSVVPGAACDQPGATGTKHDARYRCEQRPGEDCPHWHWIAPPGTPHGTWSPRPVGPCPACSPTPSVPPTSPPSSPTPASTRSAPAPVGGSRLPVTGPGVALLLLAGIGLAGGGSVLRWRFRRT